MFRQLWILLYILIDNFHIIISKYMPPSFAIFSKGICNRRTLNLVSLYDLKDPEIEQLKSLLTGTPTEQGSRPRCRRKAFFTVNSHLKLADFYVIIFIQIPLMRRFTLQVN